MLSAPVKSSTALTATVFMSKQVSEKTLQKFKEHCPSVGFIKLLTGELQLNLQSRGLWFLKILAMVDCADDFKEILRDCYYLERLQVDETAFDELFHLAKDLGLEDIIKNNRENTFKDISSSHQPPTKAA